MKSHIGKRSVNRIAQPPRRQLHAADFRLVVAEFLLDIGNPGVNVQKLQRLLIESGWPVHQGWMLSALCKKDSEFIIQGGSVWVG